MSALDDIIRVYDENVDDSEWVTEARAELAQLRADYQRAFDAVTRLDAQVAEQAWKIEWLTLDIGLDGFAAINRLIAACERGDIAQYHASDLGIARDEIMRQARQLESARNVMTATIAGAGTGHMRSWLDANPAQKERE